MFELSERKSNLLVGMYSLLTAGLLYFVLVFHTALINVFGLPAFIDELVILAGLLFISFRAIREPVARQFLFLFLTGIFVFTLLSFESLRHRGLVGVLIQNLIHLKFIIIFGFFWLTLGDKSPKVVKFVLFTTIIFLVLNLLSGEAFNHLLDVTPNIRGGDVRPIGIQGDTAGLGLTFAFIGLYYLVRDQANYSTSQIFTLSLFIFLILLATTRTGLVMVPLVALWWMRSSYKLFFLMLLLTPVAFFALRDSSYIQELIEITILNIQWTVDSPEEIGYIRGIMIYYSVVLAYSRFPFGTGAGSYGTVMSDNSPVYTEIGLQNSVFFLNKTGIYDSNVASLLGEFGVLGLLFFAFLVYRVFTTPERCTNGKRKWSPGFKFCFLSLAAAYSIAVPLFMNSYPAVILCLVAVAAYFQEEKVSNSITEKGS